MTAAGIASLSELAIEPVAGPLDADVAVPGSKSVTNRALVCAALATGTSELTGVLLAEDTAAMLGCLAALGVRVELDESDPATPAALVHGAAGRLAPGPVALDARMSGTTARFVAPMVAVAGAGTYHLDGHPALRRRPMAEAVRALRALGAVVDEPGEPGHLPLVVHGRDGRDLCRVEVPSARSSQFLSGLLLSAGALPAPATFVTDVGGVSRPYLALTAAVMGAFAMDVSPLGEAGAWQVGGGGYRAASYRVEPDASAASYAFAAAAVAGGRVRVDGLGRGTAQGDLAFVDVLARMGCDVTMTDGWTEVRRAPETSLRGVEVDLADCSDTAQTLAMVAAVAGSPTRVTGIGFIRAKETDRIAAVVTELRRCGVDADEEHDGFVVRPRPGAVHGARIETYDDHRMAMSFAVLGLAVPGITIADPGCVAKTFPGFFTLLDALRQSPRNDGSVTSLGAASTLQRVTRSRLSRKAEVPLEFNEYQELAKLSDQSTGNDPTNIVVPVLGLVGEAGSLADIFKKWLRDGINFDTQKAFAKTELGDVLWYLTNIATRFDLSLEEIAAHNLERTKSRYGFGAGRKDEPEARRILDEDVPGTERFPRRIVFHFWEEVADDHRMASMAIVHATPNSFPLGRVGDRKGQGFTIGDPLRNNARIDDGYRYHDAIHIGFLTVLGWSPVLRGLMRLKRKSDAVLDEVEDSARAVDVEEGLSTQLAERATNFQDFLEERYVDNETLDLVLEHVKSLEVHIRPGWMWKQAISQGFRCLRALHENGGGYLDANLDDRMLSYSKLEPLYRS